jgi:sulfur relay (sulfurtransferase) DsrC/TusE family protein
MSLTRPAPSLEADRLCDHAYWGPLGRISLEVEEAARVEGLWPVTEAHWKVIQFVRAYTRDRSGPPALVRVARATGFRLSHLGQLFPDGVVRTVVRLTGLDQPKDTAPVCPYRVPRAQQN